MSIKNFSPNGAAGVGGVGVEPGEEVEGEEEEVVRADAVIVALPLPLVQQGVVEFDPPLREVRFPIFVTFFSRFSVGVRGRVGLAT